MTERIFLKNKNGVVIIIALLMLLVLTLIGISAISTTTFDTNISGNERVGADAFYASEAGLQVAINQLPDTKPILKTKLKEDSDYWSGGPTDKGNPKSLQNLGLYPQAGFDSSWGFKRFQVNTTGESIEVMKQIEVQVSLGPFNAGTEYNN
jgi:Na+-transporting methylmalonyl-CoA/oxaloacetate decarboxylase gamma subunit